MDVLGIGTDITECLRIAQMIERHGELFVDRVYTPEEIRYCQRRKQATQHFTGRWAAKEAVSKVLGLGVRGIGWQDIEIERPVNLDRPNATTDVPDDTEVNITVHKRPSPRKPGSKSSDRDRPVDPDVPDSDGPENTPNVALRGGASRSPSRTGPRCADSTGLDGAS